ncbi:uncharacterized protein C19orf44 homolog [Melopsittacus undulatus]|uniref:uncharacterized protein C19orf44 homolog n=1 Tax=Melopsittacus undulatus TaxID=13146 RepID=UPI00146C97C3|nr:uncharacterized protein C19orf44 homolog [Melopsittacus undulatus]
MAAVSRVQRGPAGGGQRHHSDSQRLITATLSLQPRSCSDFSAVDPEQTGRARFCHSRLGLHHEDTHGNQWRRMLGSALLAANSLGAKSTLGSASHARSSSALSRVAQLESKIVNRRKQLELQNTDLGQKPLSEESLSSASSHKPSAKGKRYLKNHATASEYMTLGNACSKEEESIQSPKRNVTVKQQLHLDSDEEEMRELMECSSVNENHRVVASNSKWGPKRKTPVSSGIPPPSPKEISLTEGSKASCLHSRYSESRTGSPARNTSLRHNVRSLSLSSSMKDSTVKITLPRTGTTKQSQKSLESDRSEITSLDELFSKAADAEDSANSSSDDFRLNILSLDDLAPSITSEAAELKQQGGHRQITQESNRNPKKDTFLVEKDQGSLQMTSVVAGVKNPDEDVEKTVTEAGISEHLSRVSADLPRQKQAYLDHDDRTINAEYSEDFEGSPSTTDRDSVAKMSEEHSESCTSSGKDPSSALSPRLARARQERVRRVTVRERAVQTMDPPFTYCWPKANTSAVLDPPVGNSYVDPIPIASHVISMDAVEALTAYSPSALALNTMLKQHLLLIQQFVENIRHLHISLVESLENENFHYHTLEEAKEYIKKHKPPPLTLEQAREEVQKAQEEKLL